MPRIFVFGSGYSRSSRIYSRSLKFSIPSLFSNSNSEPSYRNFPSGTNFRTLQETVIIHTNKAQIINQFNFIPELFLLRFRSIFARFFVYNWQPEFVKLIEFSGEDQSQSANNSLSINYIFVYIFSKASDPELAIFGDQIFYTDIADQWIFFLRIRITAFDINLATDIHDESVIQKVLLCCYIQCSSGFGCLSVIIRIAVQSKI